MNYCRKDTYLCSRDWTKTVAGESISQCTVTWTVRDQLPKGRGASDAMVLDGKDGDSMIKLGRDANGLPSAVIERSLSTWW